MSRLDSAPRLLIVRTDRVGDVIISTSCLQPLRKCFPEGKFYFMARPVMAPIFHDHPELEGFLPRTVGGRTMSELYALSQQLKSLQLDTVVFLHPDPEVTIAAYGAGIPRRLGYRRGIPEWTLSESFSDRRSEGRQHEACYNLDLLKPLGVQPPENLRASLSLPHDAWQRVKAKPRKLPTQPGYIVLNLTAHSPVARWPAENFARLTRQIWHELKLEVVLIGSQRNDPSRLEYLKCLGSDSVRVQDWTEETDLAELACLLKMARALVTRDTGPSHLAAAVNCPVLVLFGRTSPLYGPVRWKPLGEHVRVILSKTVRQRGERNENFWRRCFAEIKPDEVYRELEHLLQSTPTLSEQT